MAGFARSLRRNWDAALAIALVYMAIAIYLGPAFVFVACFVSGCGYIVHVALKR